MEFTLGQIAALIGGKVEGNPEEKVSTISSIEDGKPGGIAFLSNPKYEPHLYTTKASGVIVNEDFKPTKNIQTSLVRVKDAYLAFTALLQEYQRIISFSKSGIEQPSFVGKGTTHGENLYLGAFAYIGDNVRIGDNVKIYPHVYIGDGAVIGNNTILYPGAKVYPKSRVGNHCTLQAGCVIGSHGFGFAPKADGTYENIPQIGNVILEDHVDIGANTTVDCATFESTIIRKGSKIDNLVQVAHNVVIGQNTVIAAQAGISGSSKVGDQVMIGGQVGIAGHIQIANKTAIAAQSGIMRNSKEGDILMGSPAQEKTDYMKSQVVYRKLPELMKRVEQLEEKILNLPA